MKITYKDEVFEVENSIKISELLKTQIAENEYKVVGAKFNNEYQGLDYEIKEDGNVELIDISMKEGTKIYRRTLIYLMGKAFEQVYPEALITVAYQLSNEMFCEVDNMKVTKEMIEKVKEKMEEIIKKDLLIEKKEMTRTEAEKFFEETGTLRGKLQLELESNKNIKIFFSFFPILLCMNHNHSNRCY